MAMEKYVEIRSGTHTHAHEHQVWLKVANQSFMVGIPSDELHGAEFIRDMLVVALERIVTENAGGFVTKAAAKA